MTGVELTVRLYVLDIPITIKRGIEEFLEEPELESLLTEFDFHEIDGAILGSVNYPENIEVRRFALLYKNADSTRQAELSDTLAKLLQARANLPYLWAASRCLYYIGAEALPNFGGVNYIYPDITPPRQIPYVVIKDEEHRLPMTIPLHFYMNLRKALKTS